MGQNLSNDVQDKTADISGSGRERKSLVSKIVLAAMFAFGPYCGRFAGVPASGSHEPKAPKLKSQLVQLCHHPGLSNFGYPRTHAVFSQADQPQLRCFVYKNGSISQKISSSKIVFGGIL
jgi:hypothetical protein